MNNMLSFIFLKINRILSKVFSFYNEYLQDMNKNLDELKLPDKLKNKKIYYKDLKQKELPSLQQLCHEKIKEKIDIFCFPYLELDKKIKNIILKNDLNKDEINEIENKLDNIEKKENMSISKDQKIVLENLRQNLKQYINNNIDKKNHEIQEEKGIDFLNSFKDEINSIDLQNQLSTSGYKPSSPKM